MAKNYFNLSTDAKLFEELGKQPTWWKTILSDKELYVNVRKDNRINVYYLGASVLFSAMGHPFQQFAEMMSSSSVTSGCSLVCKSTDLCLPSYGLT